MSPERGSSTTAIAALARCAGSGVDLASATYWMVRSIVSMMPCPGCGGRSVCGASTSGRARRVRRSPARHTGELRVPGSLDALEPALGALEPEHVRRALGSDRAGAAREEAEPGLAQAFTARRPTAAASGEARRRSGSPSAPREPPPRDPDERRDAAATRTGSRRCALDEERLGGGRRRQRAPWRSTIGPRWARRTTVREYWRSAIWPGHVLHDHQPRQAPVRPPNTRPGRPRAGGPASGRPCPSTGAGRRERRGAVALRREPSRRSRTLARAD